MFLEVNYTVISSGGNPKDMQRPAYITTREMFVKDMDYLNKFSEKMHNLNTWKMDGGCDIHVYYAAAQIQVRWRGNAKPFKGDLKLFNHSKCSSCFAGRSIDFIGTACPCGAGSFVVFKNGND